MSITEPTPEEARARVAQATRAAGPVRSEDRLFAVRLFALAMVVVALSVVIVFLTALPSWAGPGEGILAGLAMAGAALIMVAAQQRQHAFTRAGNRLFTFTLLFWIVWAELVWQYGTHSDWLSVAQAQSSRELHFVLTAIIGVVPLLAGAVVFRFRR